MPVRGSRVGTSGERAARVLCIVVTALTVLICGLFALSWVKGSKGAFTDIRSTARKAGSDHLDTALYLARAGFVLFGAAVVLALLALLPLPPTPGGNTFARIGLVLVAGVATGRHITTMHTLSTGDTVLRFGAGLGLLGYLAVLASTIVGARRVPR